MRSSGHVLRRTLLVLAMFASSAGLAQQPKPTTVQQLVLTPDYQRNVARLFAQLPPDVFQRCPALVSPGSTVTVITPATFAPDGYPTAGAWMQRFPVSGCGNDTTINIYFQAEPDEKVTSIVAAPGDTHAGLVLQRDAIRYVTIAVTAREKDCAALHLRTTAYLGADASSTAARRPWREVWTVAACGRRYDVPVTFIPDSTGTTISTALARPAAP